LPEHGTDGLSGRRWRCVAGSQPDTQGQHDPEETRGSEMPTAQDG
jgi:hypothetical protein